VRTFAGTVLVGLGLGASTTVAADIELSGQLLMTTDYMFRGVSQTMSEPALQAELVGEHESGWYGWAWISNVDFGLDDGAELEINVAAGYFRELSDSLAVTMETVAYVFPDTEPGFDYDYTEWLVGLQLFERLRLTVGYSHEVFGSAGAGLYYAAATTFDLSSRARLEIELGYYDLDDAYAFSYGFAEVGIVYDADPFQWRLGFLTSNDDAHENFDRSTVGDRLVAAISVSF
jgi:uncharacterized protein (TIGR02001 family)